jgi:hypothetical protein
MAFIEGSSDGATNSASAVTIVAAPAAATRRIVKLITICNPMASEAVTLTLYLYHASDTRIIWKGTLAGGETLVDDSVHVLDDTDKSIKAILVETPTTQLSFTATWGDST